MPNMINGFAVKGEAYPIKYDYEALGNKLEKTSISGIYSNNELYEAHDYALYNGVLYKCTTSLEEPENFDPNKWIEVTAMDELNALKKCSFLNKNIRDALLILLSHVTFDDENGNSYYNDFEDSLNSTIEGDYIYRCPRQDFETDYQFSLFTSMFTPSSDAEDITE